MGVGTSKTDTNIVCTFYEIEQKKIMENILRDVYINILFDKRQAHKCCFLVVLGFVRRILSTQQLYGGLVQQDNIVNVEVKQENNKIPEFVNK